MKRVLVSQRGVVAVWVLPFVLRWLKALIGKVLWDFNSSCSDVICKYCLFEMLAWGQAFGESC